MTETLTIVVPWDAGRSSPNCLRRMCWQARKRVADEAKAAATIAWRLAGSPIWYEPVRVEITLRRNRKLDPDNALAACKNALDALFVARITPNDTEEWVSYAEVRQEQIPKTSRPELVVRVFSREPAAATAGGCAAAATEIEKEGEDG